MWISCCRGRSSACPEIHIENDTIEIKDDFGSTVKMTIDQFRDLEDTISEVLPMFVSNIEDKNVGVVS